MNPINLKVFGDKTTKLEPEEHRITFPGGEISVSRTSDNKYWAHIVVNNNEHSDESIAETFFGSKIKTIQSIRIDSKSSGSKTVELDNDVYHFAVKIG